jgi:hypothetical protein
MKRFACLFLLFIGCHGIQAQSFVTLHDGGKDFPVSSPGTYIYVDKQDDWLVAKAASLLQEDIGFVTSRIPHLVHAPQPATRNLIILGTIGNSALLGQLVANKKIDLRAIEGKWEAFQLQTVMNPLPGVDRALVIAGSDKRGLAYGVFELSRQMGVSPWYWWADVPAKRKEAVYVKAGVYTYGSPTVQYRGIFINDEAPAFSGWAKEKYGRVNHLVYERIFELLLRLKGNYLWPAMWDNAFNDDDTLSPVMAHKWGIVMGTSHHEPMLRAQQEWKRYGKGQWDYTKNDTVLRSFWQKGIENMGHHESIVTLGMRGDGDMPMTQGTATELLERIVKDQRQIIETVTGKPAAQTPQMWALYKEVQDYYDKGMRVPDDVTLLLCDDNWGNIRRLPAPGSTPRSGGYGIYYHFDYVGGPRNYKWLNTNNIARVWEQMYLAYEHGVNKVWIVNVGDLKPMEFPISFFLDYAWNARAWNEDNLASYYTQWAGEQFGPAYAAPIGNLLRKYALYAARRKPELLDANTYKLDSYGEADRVLSDWTSLLAQAEKINKELPGQYQDAYFQLVLHPVKALTNLHQLYYAVAQNKRCAALQDPQANQWAGKAKDCYLQDSLLTIRYNKELTHGKWNHFMNQTHIGYTYWQQPLHNVMPVVTYVDSNAAGKASQVANTVPAPTVAPELTVSLLAGQYTKAVNGNGITWKTIPDIGREGDGVTSSPVTASIATATGNSPHLQYVVSLKDTGVANLYLYFSPTLNIYNDGGLKYALSIDDEQPQVMTLNKEDHDTRTWEGWVANNAIVKMSQHRLRKPGKHTLRYWLLSPGVVLQKLVISTRVIRGSYLGPPALAKPYIN